MCKRKGTKHHCRLEPVKVTTLAQTMLSSIKCSSWKVQNWYFKVQRKDFLFFLLTLLVRLNFDLKLKQNMFKEELVRKASSLNRLILIKFGIATKVFFSPSKSTNFPPLRSEHLRKDFAPFYSVRERVLKKEGRWSVKGFSFSPAIKTKENISLKIWFNSIIFLLPSTAYWFVVIG